MIRGDIDPSTGLHFWRFIRGKPVFVSAVVLQERREMEKKRRERFIQNNPNYVPYSHTPEQLRKKAIKKRILHWDKICAWNKEWKSKNMHRIRLSAKARYKNNPNCRERALTASALRRSQQKKLTNSNKIEVNFLYSLSKALSFGGIKHVVDHVLPIKPKHKLYCGLTNSPNLRIIPECVNAIKKNKCPLYEKAA